MSSIPRATMARLSPTSIMSMPAWSATWALGKSCAVIMVIGSPLRYRLWSVLMVTGLRALAGVAPSGECELHRTWAAGSTQQRGIIDGDSEHVRGMVCVRRGEDSRSVVFKSARNMMAMSVVVRRRRWVGWGFLNTKN